MPSKVNKTNTQSLVHLKRLERCKLVASFWVRTCNLLVQDVPEELIGIISQYVNF